MSSSAHLKRPKRPSEPSMNAHAHNGQPNKKPRFDTRNPSALAADELDEDDAMLAADVIGARGQQVRRSAVNIDGYDSDSDNDNFDSRAATKAKAQKAAAAARQPKRQGADNDDDDDDDDDDMFADLEEDNSGGGGGGGGGGDDSDDEDGEGIDGKKKKKAVRFLEEEEIEGQVVSSKSGGHVNADFRSYINNQGNDEDMDNKVDSSSDSEVGDDVRASIGDDLDKEVGAGSKKIHAPKLDAFNMRQEQEEGRFDDQGNYVRKAVDPDAKHDLWMEGISKKEIRAAKEAEEKREQERRRRNLEDDSKSIPDILSTLIPLLDRGETVLEALARLAKAKATEKKVPKWQNKQKNKKQQQQQQQQQQQDAGNTHSEATEVDAAEVKRRQDVEAITAAADLLLGRGQPEIYEAERELLVRQYNREADTPWQDAPTKQDTEDKMWEYKWTDARDGDNTINGPFDSNTMRAWNDAGYFGEGVVFRQAGDSSKTSWTRVLPV